MANNALVDSICGGGKQSVDPKGIVPKLAQLYAYALFRLDFRSRYPGGYTFEDWDIISRNVPIASSLIQEIVDQIRSDFRNYTSQSARNRALAKAGNYSELKEGRQVRGDGIGLAIDPLQRQVVCELLEITTVDDADKCIAEDLTPKLALLRGPIKTLLDAKLANLRSNASFVPQAFVAWGTPWIIPPALAVVPWFPDTSNGPPSKFRWICFAPTYLYRPYPLATPFIPAATEPETAPARGLILYSYHEAQTGAIPVEVFKRFANWLKARPRSANDPFGLLPAPLANQYWQNNNADLQQFLGYVALAGIVLGAIALAVWVAPALFPIATALFEGGLSTAAGLAAQGATLVESLSQALPATLTVSQTAMAAAVNVGLGGSAGNLIFIK